VIYPTAYVGEGVSIGAESVLFPASVVLAGTQIGACCRIGPGAVVGFEGFSLHREATGYRRVPQVGRVILGDGVSIGANTCVDRAFLEQTVIGAGSQLDNLVQVGHNCVIGENVVIAGQAGLSGSVRLGADSVIGGQAGISDHAEIGPRTLLGARAGVSGDLEGDQAYLGAPASPARLGKKIWIALRELPDLLKRVRRIERHLGGAGSDDF
jgi:UDP-3-O-[3-hydroxymyristoyl] glucosamine N-acyltransferase